MDTGTGSSRKRKAYTTN